MLRNACLIPIWSRSIAASATFADIHPLIFFFSLASSISFFANSYLNWPPRIIFSLFDKWVKGSLKRISSYPQKSFCTENYHPHRSGITVLPCQIRYRDPCTCNWYVSPPALSLPKPLPFWETACSNFEIGMGGVGGRFPYIFTQR